MPRPSPSSFMTDPGTVQIQPFCILDYGDVPELREFRTFTRLGQRASHPKLGLKLLVPHQ